MRVRTVLGEILPVLGTIGLLGLWAFQQTGMENRASELRRLDVSQSVYQTYQSNNALFNAMVELSKKDQRATDQIRTFQVYNYELGLQAIEGALKTEDRAGVPEAPGAYDPSVEVTAKLAATQKRLEELQGRLASEKAAVSAEGASAKRLYLWAYIALSTIMIVGAVFKCIDKLLPNQEAPAGSGSGSMRAGA